MPWIDKMNTYNKYFISWVQNLKGWAQNSQKKQIQLIRNLAKHLGRLAELFGQRYTKNAVSQSIFKIFKKFKLLWIDKMNTYNKYFISWEQNLKGWAQNSQNRYSKRNHATYIFGAVRSFILSSSRRFGRASLKL